MSRYAPIPNPKHRAHLDFKVHQDDCEMEDDEKYFEQLSLIKFPTTPEIVGPLDVKLDIDDRRAFHVPIKNWGTEMKGEIVIPTSLGFFKTAIQTTTTDNQNKHVFGAVNQAAGYKLGTAWKITEVKTQKDPNEEHDKLTQEILQCKEVLAKKQIADPEDIRRATFLLHQASVRLSKMGYKRTPSDRERSSSSSCSSLSDHSEQPGKEMKSKDMKKRN